MSEAEATSTAGSVAVLDNEIQIRSWQESYNFAQTVIRSGLAPKAFRSEEQVMVAVQMGAELGFSPMRALSHIAVVNGKPTLMGDAAKALALGSGLVGPTGIVDSIEGEGDDMRSVVRSQRVGTNDIHKTVFSVADAKRAKLWGKQGPWTEYPKRMLYYRALGFHLRDHYPDALFGMKIAEEVRDYPVTASVTVEKPEGPDPLLVGAGVDTDEEPPESEGEMSAEEKAEIEAAERAEGS